MCLREKREREREREGERGGEREEERERKRGREREGERERKRERKRGGGEREQLERFIKTIRTDVNSFKTNCTNVGISKTLHEPVLHFVYLAKFGRLRRL